MKKELLLIPVLMFFMGCASAPVAPPKKTIDDVVNNLAKTLDNCPALNGRERPLISFEGILWSNGNHNYEENPETIEVGNQLVLKLMSTGKVKFISADERKRISEEYEHSASGVVAESKAVLGGEQIAPTLLLKGEITANKEQIHGEKSWGSIEVTNVATHKYMIKVVNFKTSALECVAIDNISESQKFDCDSSSGNCSYK